MSDKVSDSELDDAIEEEVATEDAAAGEEETNEKKEEEGAEEEKEEVEETGKSEEAAEEHKVSSRLGRKVKNLEDRIAAYESVERQKEPVEELDSEDETSVSMKDVRVLIAKAKKEDEETKTAYNNTYLQTAISLSEHEDEEFANTVLDEMDTNFNTLYSDDPTKDAEMNYLKAQNAVLRKTQNKGKENPLKGDKPKAALGVTGGDTNTQSTFKMPKLDEHAQDLIKHSNFTEEDIRDALTSKTLRITGEYPVKNV